jgi:hypothetical protein
MERTELMVVKCAKLLRAFLFHIIRSSGARRHSPSGRWRESRPALCLFARSPTIKSVLFIAGELRRPSRDSLVFSWRSVFEISDCRPSGS